MSRVVRKNISTTVAIYKYPMYGGVDNVVLDLAFGRRDIDSVVAEYDVVRQSCSRRINYVYRIAATGTDVVVIDPSIRTRGYSYPLTTNDLVILDVSPGRAG